MNIFQKMRVGFKKPVGKIGKRTSANAAVPSRLLSTWTTTPKGANIDTKTQAPVLVARSRDLVLNNPYAQQFMSLLKVNVVGARGIRLQARTTELASDQGKTGTLDERANDQIEKAWLQWGKKGSCTMDGQNSWIDVQNMVLECVARDGEVFVRKVKGRSTKNKFMFALQVIEAEYVDWSYCDPNKRIDMGIKYDEWSRPVSYFFWTQHPNGGLVGGSRKRTEIPAAEIEHIFSSRRAGQRRGLPWMTSGMDKMKMIDGYMEAEITAARAGASKMGFYISKDGDGADPDDYGQDGSLIQDFEPATISQAPNGFDFKAFDPQHPSTAYGDFIKSNLRAMASAFGVTYPSLASDLEGVNYSSIRHGALEERDHYKALQQWLVENLHERIFDDWLNMSLSFGGLMLPLTKINKFREVVWMPRGWAWVDPVKDATANKLMREEGIKSRTAAASELGFDWADQVDAIEKEKDKLEKGGLLGQDEQKNESGTHEED